MIIRLSLAVSALILALALVITITLPDFVTPAMLGFIEVFK